MDKIASFPLGVYQVQQPGLNETFKMAVNCCQRMCHFGMSLKPMGGITSHLGHKVILGSSIGSQTLIFGWPRATLTVFLMEY